MRILIAVDSTKGGAGNIAQIMALYFKEHGYDTHLLFTMGMSNTKHDITGLNTYCLSENYKGIIKQISGVKKIIKEINPDIIISFLHTVSPVVLASQWLTKTPVIVSERSNPYTNVKTKKYRLFRKITYRRANLVTVQFDVFKEFDKRLFKKKFGLSVKKYVIQKKINYACELLMVHRYSINQIAEMCNFSDVYYFSKQFKLQIGISPTEYIKKYKNQHD